MKANLHAILLDIDLQFLTFCVKYTNVCLETTDILCIFNKSTLTGVRSRQLKLNKKNYGFLETENGTSSYLFISQCNPLCFLCNPLCFLLAFIALKVFHYMKYHLMKYPNYFTCLILIIIIISVLFHTCLSVFCYLCEMHLIPLYIYFNRARNLWSVL